MAARRDGVEQRREAARVREALRLDVVGQRRGGGVRRRPARDAREAASQLARERDHELGEKPTGRIDRVLGGGGTERGETTLERGVPTALHAAAHRLRRRVVCVLGEAARRRAQRRAGVRAVMRRRRALGDERREGAAEVGRRPEAVAAHGDRRHAVRKGGEDRGLRQ